jgi:hypothetical protein
VPPSQPIAGHCDRVTDRNEAQPLGGQNERCTADRAVSGSSARKLLVRTLREFGVRPLTAAMCSLGCSLKPLVAALSDGRHSATAIEVQQPYMIGRQEIAAGRLAHGENARTPFGLGWAAFLIS